MSNYFTVDGGTTNTRISLVCDYRITATKKINIGVGSGDTAYLKKAIRDAISELILQSGLTEKDIERILASGMISSEKGLCDLPHITVPAGQSELNSSMYETVIEDISAIPFVFIRGVKKIGQGLDDVDMMRGEETELMGIIGENDGKDRLYVLPGSHSKHISVDAKCRIVDFRTMLTGELLAAVIQHTILRYATDFSHSAVIETELINGFLYAREHGLNESLFKTRILKNCFGASEEQCFSFLLGCILCDEVEAIIRSKEETVVLGGQVNFRNAIALLLKEFSRKELVILSDRDVEYSTVLGAIRIYEHN